MISKQKKYHIDVVTKYFYPLWAGIEVNIANVYGFMAEKEWGVDLHTSKDIPSHPEPLESDAVFRNIRIHRYKWQWWGCNLKIKWDKTDAIALHNFNIFPHSWIMIYAGIRRLMGLKTPKIFLTPHGGFTIATGWHTYPIWQRIIKKTYHATLGIFLINQVVDAFRAVSEWEGQEAIKAGLNPKKLYVITNGLEDEAYKNIDKLASKKIKDKVKQLGTYVLSIGRIHPIKNQLTTIKAMTLIDPKVKLAIVGPITDPEYYKKLQAEIKRLGLNKRVLFLGVISGVDKYYLLRNCLAYSHMSTWESYCNTVHEAMSQGCCCIVSKDTALEELVKDGVSGYAVPTYDFNAVARIINSILKNPRSKTIAKIKKEAKLYTKGHSWRIISKKVSEVYKSYLQKV